MLNKESIEKLNKFKTLALAVSGGKDSMYLLNFFCENKKVLPRFFVININHNLRGQESDMDSTFVLDYCKENNVEVKYYSEDINKYCKDNGYGIEQGARLRRREIFKEIVSSNLADRVVTAHHKDDQVESILMHIFRGSGLRGLVGMNFDDGVLLRPLLDISSEEIFNYMHKHNLPYRDDSTNTDTDYTRNKLRHDIIPEIKSIYPGLLNNICRLGGVAKEANEFIQQYNPKAKIENSELILDLAEIKKKNILSISYIIDGLDRIGWRVDIEEKHLDLIFDLAHKKVGAKINLPWDIIAYKEQKNIVLTKSKKAAFKEEPFFIGEKVLGEYKVNVSLEKLDNSLRMDLDKIQGAVFRQRKTKDSFLKFSGGRKSLGDFLTDKKVPLRKRDSLVVLAKGEDILAVLPIEISKSVAIDENTKTVCYIKATKM